MDESDRNEEINSGNFNTDIYTQIVKAGSRTYFFDVKSTKKEEYYLTITESKKFARSDGQYKYEKHKIFLYKEDFEKFLDALHNCFDFIKEDESIEFESIKEEINDSGLYNECEFGNDDEDIDYTKIEFDDLNN